jgi:hypothetical protein
MSYAQLRDKRVSRLQAVVVMWLAVAAALILSAPFWTGWLINPQFGLTTHFGFITDAYGHPSCEQTPAGMPYYVHEVQRPGGGSQLYIERSARIGWLQVRWDQRVERPRLPRGETSRPMTNKETGVWREVRPARRDTGRPGSAARAPRRESVGP